MSELDVAHEVSGAPVVDVAMGVASQDLPGTELSPVEPSATDATVTAKSTAEVRNAGPEAVARQNAPDGWLEEIGRLPKVNGLTQREKEKIARKNLTFAPPPESGSGDSLANGIVIGAVAAASKVLMRGFNRMYTYRLDVLCNAIERRPPGAGLLTVSNHRSVADDPVMLGALLPPRILLRPGLVRWGLCSVDICFQNPAIGRFMTWGKALPIMRGAGVSSPLVSNAAEKLASGDWLHIYPEGRVVQKGMGYMKRGVGKMLTVAHERAAARSNAIEMTRGGMVPPVHAGLPVVLPMYHEPLENVMPQDVETHELISMAPRLRNRMYTIVGDPVDLRDIFERLMPACKRAGGTASDPEECVALYDAIADRLGMSIRLLRAELRLRVRTEHGEFLGDPYETS